ncbi:NUDIX hydrolase [Bailinhaonella thermotolerans]|uniref:NUDIX hydrolase n=1 Tax=Bailinhaonella thermotolerans TaxID=1070861 RepID=A0A3A4B144_9ACTN|nr:NUDIX hydrolase [Bailinhaonella thermotolerans]RJL31813.1 NUDIX hydrolase [Bailinhaonella thermotolerans]
MSDEGQETRWVVHGERLIYDNRWVRLALVDVELPDGDRFEHHVVHLDRAAIMAILDDSDRVLMMWRHRFVFDRWGWELPGGLIDAGEDAEATAVREAEEETGYRPKGVQHLVTFQPMVGMVDSEHVIYMARGAEKIGEPIEVTEAQRLAWIPLADVPDMIARGEIWNSGTLVALLYLRDRLNSGTV